MLVGQQYAVLQFSVKLFHTLVDQIFTETENPFETH